MNRAIMQVIIQGRVQGVGYRAWVEHQARASRLEGWVRNRRDGSVEAVFAGHAKAVAEMVALCRHGPPGAKVTAVLKESADSDQLKLRHPDETFSVLSTA
jgi:acylphosphatase